MQIAAHGRFAQVPLNLVDDPALPSRAEMSDEKMDQLVESVRANGILQNVVLVERGDRFEVVAGHRRTVAARRAGLPFVPAMVYPADAPSLRVIQAHENGRREDVNVVDEALWFAELLERDCGNDVERLAGLVGEKLTYVLNRLELLALDDEIREALRLEKIKIGVARELMKCDDPSYRRYYLEHAIKSGATIAVVIAWVTEWRNIFGTPHPETPAPTVTPGPIVVDRYDPHRCYICGKSDPRFIPEQVPVHTHCKLAILDPILQGAGNPAGSDS